jgi:hypothetical protein
MIDEPHLDRVEHYSNRLMDTFRDMAPCNANEFPLFMLALSHVVGVLIGRVAEAEQKPLKPFLKLTQQAIANAAYGYDADRRAHMQ